MEKLSAQEIEDKMSELHETWFLEGDHLRLELEFEDFIGAFSFMTAVAMMAERINHHPEWSNVYNSVSIALSTHDAGGISNKDFELAMLIDQLA